MKIFVSYSRRDAWDFADQISQTLKEEHDIYTDIDDIEVGGIWTNIIEDNISKCDIFFVIITFAALRSSEVEKEVLQAQKKNRRIIPCVYRGIEINQLKWGLGGLQGIEFANEHQLAREIYLKIYQYQNKVQPKLDATAQTTVEPTKKSKQERVNKTEEVKPPVIKTEEVKPPVIKTEEVKPQENNSSVSRMKLFISYPRDDMDIAQHIHRYLSEDYDIFLDQSSIRGGQNWAKIIHDNISRCDCFIIIITKRSLKSIEVSNEVNEAVQQQKRIIPCKYRPIQWQKIPWKFAEINGVEFDDKFDLARKIDDMISQEIVGSY